MVTYLNMTTWINISNEHERDYSHSRKDNFLLIFYFLLSGWESVTDRVISCVLGQGATRYIEMQFLFFVHRIVQCRQSH